MVNRRIVVKGLAAVALLVGVMACGAAPEEPTEETGQTQESARPPQPCYESLILCIEGYHAMTLPGCKQVCVPDKPVKDACNPSCGDGEYCAECKTVNGSGFFCMDVGTAC